MAGLPHDDASCMKAGAQTKHVLVFAWFALKQMLRQGSKHRELIWLSRMEESVAGSVKERDKV